MSTWLDGVRRRCRFRDGGFGRYRQRHRRGGEPSAVVKPFSQRTSPTGVPEELLPRDTGQASALWRSWLTAKRMLVVLDNALNARQLAPLLPGSPGHLFLVTSRGPAARARWGRPPVTGADGRS
ncbi:hypothetical protein Amsp01_048480 [Amycolatopsis sp. NBRC 101858]|nr:hypothetical protein Amsp01_048480 [Amycolatopsis sp. NBRC 101858]